MAKQWWSYNPEDGWQRCTEREAFQRRGLLDSGAPDFEGWKVVEVDEDVDMAAVGGVSPVKE